MNVQEQFGMQPQVSTVAQDSPDKIYAIAIRPVDRGYIVEVGCKTFAMSDTDELIRYLSDYLIDPGSIHKQFYAGELFKKTRK